MSADIWLEADCCSAHDHNITHNLAPMFREAGVDWHEYRDGEQHASVLLREVAHALTRMADEPARFKALNPPNGWGNYDGALAFLVRLAVDCLRHPDAIVRVSL
jgi:hypothetical protein